MECADWSFLRACAGGARPGGANSSGGVRRRFVFALHCESCTVLWRLGFHHSEGARHTERHGRGLHFERSRHEGVHVGRVLRPSCARQQLAPTRLADVRGRTADALHPAAGRAGHRGRQHRRRGRRCRARARTGGRRAHGPSPRRSWRASWTTCRSTRCATCCES